MKARLAGNAYFRGGLLFLSCFAGALVSAPLGEEAGGSNRVTAESLRLVPFPKEVRVEGNGFRLDRPCRLEAPVGESETVSRLLNEEWGRAGMPAITVGAPSLEAMAWVFHVAPVGDARGAERIAVPPLPESEAPEAYALDVRPDGMVCAARTAAGLIHGAQTLRQLVRANRRGAALPGVRIRDWPSLRWRCFQDDMTRGPSSTLETLKYEASLGSYLKLNLMTFYMEYQFAFRKHPQIGPTNGSLTPADLSALVGYLKPLHLDLLGNQQSFGHFGAILRHPEFAAMRETGDVLTPVREETYQLLDDLYAEVCPLLPFPWFNVCCDETYGLGTGPSKALAQQIGVGGVYVRHIRRVHDLLRDRYQKRMMMWGDIILQHPDQLAQVPKDTIMLTWGYDARPSFEDQILPFARSGYEFLVCPGVNNWSRILPDFDVALTNIRNFVRDGVQHGALGMLNTDWEDDGEAINAVKWHADAWAAECAWNGAATPPEVFNRRIGGVLFGEAGHHFGDAITALAPTHRLPGMNGLMNARFWENDFAPRSNPAQIPVVASNLLARVQPALQHLDACRREAQCNVQVLEAIRFGARRAGWIGRRMVDGLEAAQRYAAACDAAQGSVGGQRAGADAALVRVEELVRENRAELEGLRIEFERLWRSESKPYALDWTLKRYTNRLADFDALRTRVATARAALATNGPLPSPDQIGLGLPQPLSRCVRPRQVLTTPLAPTAAWVEREATHRLGLTVRAGDADRFDGPVEVEVALPDDLAAKPARAWIVARSADASLPAGAAADLVEAPVQLMRAHARGKCRLVLVLPGRLARGAEAWVHVYLGLQRPPPAPPGAAATHPDGARHWLENDRVRLLLGPEGAHVYRWEVKAAGQRDLTMPGESGWAGFSDMMPTRHATHRLQRTASGPALVEFECQDPGGATKTVRFYAGASWIEVFLSEPTSVYWDFDAPANFAADGPTPGTWLFSDGRSGRVGREADGVPAQVKAPGTAWGMKYNDQKLALGLITPEVLALHVVAPGAGAGGAGIEGSPLAMHFVTFAGRLELAAAETMNRLQTTLDLKHPVVVDVHGLAQAPSSPDR